MENEMPTNYQFDEIIENAICTAMSNLYFEVETEYDPEVIKAKIKMMAKKKEVSPETNQN